MTKKQANGIAYILGDFDEIKQFCDENNLTMLKVPQYRLTEKGKELFESYEFYTTIQE
jgi:predicted transcriptional regulator